VRARFNVRPDAGADVRGRPLRRGPQRTGRCLRRVPHGEGFDRWARMLGAQIQHVREEQDVPASELAAAIGVWETTIHKWERGARQPTTRRLKQIADALGVLVMDLMPRAS
jgi:ribosome-binding protein aMBF1 (putative translation factor)